MSVIMSKKQFAACLKSPLQVATSLKKNDEKCTQKFLLIYPENSQSIQTFRRFFSTNNILISFNLIIYF